MHYITQRVVLWPIALFLVCAAPHCCTRAENLRGRPVQSKIQNILFIVSDDLKASVLGCYGDPFCHTPNLDDLAKRSVVFSQAYCQGVVCGPSRTSFMHSRYVGKSKVNLGETFRRAGWHTARVGKIYHMRVPGDIIAGTDGADIASSWSQRFNSPGPETHTRGDYACLNLNVFTRALENRQSTQMPHRMFSIVEADTDGAEQADYKSASKAIELLRENANRPFFLAVGLVRPHYPMVAPKRFFELHPWETLPLPAAIDEDLEDIPAAGLAGTQSSKNPIGKYPDNQKRMWSGYYASVSFMDEQVGRILAELDRLGLRESTAIVFTSDHGYHLGEHGFWQKANLHQEVIRIPLIISVPGIDAAKSESIVELVDLFPTFCNLAGIEPPDSVQGQSLVPVLQNPQAIVKEGALSFHGGGLSLRVPGWHYMRYKDGSQELYDHQEDPEEFYNLAKQAKHQPKVDELNGMLDRLLDRYGIEKRL